MANSVIGALRVMLGMDTAEFEQGATRAQRATARFEKDMTKLGGNLQKIGAGMTLALTAPLTAFGVSSFKAASDAAELQSAFNQTFGALAGAMNDWAVKTGDAMGRSTQSMQQLANTFGIFFNQAAPTREEAAKMSQTFAVLAQDLSSFYNVTESEALAKLRSGLSGESEPLRDFGVFLSEAAVQSKALEMGLTGINDPLTEQEKVLARYVIILEQTKKAQGDVERTSGGTANQIRAAQAAFAELQVVVGTKLLPVITPLIEKLAAMLEWFTTLPEPVQTFALAAAGIGAALGPAITALGTIITIAPKLVTAFKAIEVAAWWLAANPAILGFAVVIGGIVAAWYYWDEIPGIVRRVYEGVKRWLVEKLAGVLVWLRDKILAVTGFFKDMYVAVVGNSYVPDMVTEIGTEFARLQQLMVDPAEKAAKGTKEAMRNMATEVSGLLDRLFPQIAETRRQMEELALLDKAQASGLISDDLRRQARLKVLVGDGKAPVSEGLLGTEPLEEARKVADYAERVGSEMKRLGDRTQVQTVRIAQTFQDMVDKSLSALRQLAGGIKSGNFFDILEGVIGLGMQLGQAGVFGRGFQSRLQQTPGFATGGTMRLGGMAGVDRNVLSLNGSPIARVTAGETMQIRPANDRGAGTTIVQNYYTLPSDEFWNRVDTRAATIAQPVARAEVGNAMMRSRAAQGRSLA
ncbi:phage tail tape measure protein [Erythrobacter sp. NE805]|uniref:phage tail tape measure protein n=1 Tax=Erythrobacter sp. NE805 TaxID=3389875 RepID=UPI00396B29FE